jgi:hypothetical protein
MHVTGAPQEKEKGTGRIPEDIMAENCPKLTKDMNPYNQDTPQSSNRVNPKTH